MRNDLEKRLREIEAKLGDDPLSDLSSLPYVDYLNGLDTYSEDEWEEIMHDDYVTIVRCRTTGIFRGVYALRIPDEELTVEQRKWL